MWNVVKDLFCAALVKVDVAGVDSEAVEEVSPELLVMAGFCGRTVFFLPLLDVSTPAHLEFGEVMADRGAVTQSRRGHTTRI